MKYVYFDCFSGVSGDMALGALIDAASGAGMAGVKSYFLNEINKLSCSDEFKISIEKKTLNGIAGTDVRVECSPSGHRGYSDVCAVIDSSILGDGVKQMAKAVFYTLGRAEARVHGVEVEQVHFHELGAVDALVDITGTAILLDYIGCAAFCSDINVGSGTVKCAHGVLPVPAPATSLILENMRIFPSPGGEKATPTGAALMKTLTEQAPYPTMRLTGCGYGFGKRDTGSLNALRVLIGESSQDANDWAVLLQTGVDDMTGEELGFAAETLLSQGALDVWCAPIQMKKGRPGYELSVLCGYGDQSKFIKLIFKHTTTLGVRVFPAERAVMRREVSRGAPVAVKTAKGYGEIKTKPEYEDLARYARAHGVSLFEARNHIKAEDKHE